MERELLMITNLMMIQIGDLVRAEGLNPAVAILGVPRVMIMVLRTGSLRIHGVLGVRTTGQTGGITPLGETVAAGGAATGGKIAGGASGIHGALPPPTPVPPTAAQGMIASSPPGGRLETADGMMALELSRSAQRTPEAQVRRWWSLPLTAKSTPPTTISDPRRGRMFAK